jgi:hypothetical protein
MSKTLLAEHRLPTGSSKIDINDWTKENLFESLHFPPVELITNSTFIRNAYYRNLCSNVHKRTQTPVSTMYNFFSASEIKALIYKLYQV